MKLTERVSYLRGLIDGMEIKDSKQGKVIAMIADILGDICVPDYRLCQVAVAAVGSAALHPVGIARGVCRADAQRGARTRRTQVHASPS